MNKIVTTLSMVLLLCGAGRRAEATSIDFLGEGKVGVVGIHSPTFGNLTVYAGELDWRWIGTPPPGFDSAAFYTYCVDVNNYLTDPENVVVRSSTELTTPVGDAGARAAWLINTYAPTIHQSGTGNDAAALQVAVWEAINDTTADLDHGTFYLTSVSAPIKTEAQDFLTALFAAPYANARAIWLDAPLGAGQDQMIPTPEPASLLLLGSGLAFAFRRASRKDA